MQALEQLAVLHEEIDAGKLRDRGQDTGQEEEFPPWAQPISTHVPGRAIAQVFREGHDLLPDPMRRENPRDQVIDLSGSGLIVPEQPPFHHEIPPIWE